MASKVSRQAVPTLSKDRHLTIYSHWEAPKRPVMLKRKRDFWPTTFGWWSSYERYMSCRRDMGNNNSFWNSFKHQNINRHMKHCNNTLPRGRIYWNIAKGTTEGWVHLSKVTSWSRIYKSKSNFIQTCTMLHYLALLCTILHCLAISCTTLHYLALYCTILHYSWYKAVVAQKVKVQYW